VSSIVAAAAASDARHSVARPSDARRSGGGRDQQRGRELRVNFVKLA